jgi:uncharacterized protein (TIGR02300 family)
MSSKEAATNAAVKAQRGTKRTCQNPECGSRFYDLNRNPIACPVCNTAYVLAPPAPETSPAARTQRPPTRKPVYPVERPKSEDAPVVDGEDLVAVEGEEEAADAAADETLIEEVEEDSPDVTGIIDAPIEDTDEKS